MQWLSPLTAVAAGAVAIPALVLLYFLKLKRRQVPISCTLLWRQAVQDLQVNSPFQRLRRNILLLLQLLALLAIILALGSPMVAWKTGEGKRYVLLIDQSASMGAMDTEEGTRLETAKQRAHDFVDTLRSESALSVTGISRPDQAMVISFSDQPQVLRTFTSNRQDLIDAIGSIKQTDGPSKLAEAVQIARAYAMPVDEEAMGRSTEAAPQLMLFSDGRLDDHDALVLRDNEMVVQQVGESNDNLAIIAVQARRSYEDPETLSVFGSLVNFRQEPASCDVQLSLDGQTIDLQHITLPPATHVSGSVRPLPGQAGVVFNLRSSASGILEVRQNKSDVLAADDAAWMILPPPKRLATLMVSQGNLVIEDALRALPLAKVDVTTPEAFDAMDVAEFEATQAYDVVLLDRCQPKQLPRSNYLVFGAPPKIDGLTANGPFEDQFILDWRARHSALRFVNLENIFAKKWWNLSLPDDAYVLAESDRGPAIAMISRPGSSFLIVNFDVLSSNWPFRPGFVMFLYNATRTLGTDLGGLNQASLSIGDAITMQVTPGSGELTIQRPDGAMVRRPIDDSGRMRYAGVDRAGVYRVQKPDKSWKSFAVNMLNGSESDITPPDEIMFAGEAVTVQSQSIAKANNDLRPLLVLIALLVLSLEWFVYNRKVHI